MQQGQIEKGFHDYWCIWKNNTFKYLHEVAYSNNIINLEDLLARLQIMIFEFSLKLYVAMNMAN